MLSSGDKQALLSFAREALKVYLGTGKKIRISLEQLPPELRKEGAVFVSLFKNGELRGCIGAMTPMQSLAQETVDKTVAACNDPRFSRVEREEYNELRIELTLLGPLVRRGAFSDSALRNALLAEKEGVFIQAGSRSATYLPQVWKEFRTQEDFFVSLCEKAGFEKMACQKGTDEAGVPIELFTYTAEICSET